MSKVSWLSWCWKKFLNYFHKDESTGPNSPLRRSSITLQNIDCIATSSFGAVFKVDTFHGLRALKKIRDFRLPRNDMKEAALLLTLDHKNLIKLYGFGKYLDKGLTFYYLDDASGGNFGIEMEFYTGRDLASVLKSRSGIDAIFNFHIYKQILSGIKYLHSFEIIHGNLKPTNVLIKGKKVKITDYGFTKYLYKGSSSMSGGCNNVCPATTIYLAPELRTGLCTVSADVYALGVILAELYTEYTAFVRVRKLIHVLGLHGSLLDLNSELTPKHKELVREMTLVEPEGRPTVDMVSASITLCHFEGHLDMGFNNLI